MVLYPLIQRKGVAMSRLQIVVDQLIHVIAEYNFTQTQIPYSLVELTHKNHNDLEVALKSLISKSMDKNDYKLRESLLNYYFHVIMTIRPLLSKETLLPEEVTQVSTYLIYLFDNMLKLCSLSQDYSHELPYDGKNKIPLYGFIRGRVSNLYHLGSETNAATVIKKILFGPLQIDENTSLVNISIRIMQMITEHQQAHVSHLESTCHVLRADKEQLQEQLSATQKVTHTMQERLDATQKFSESMQGVLIASQEALSSEQKRSALLLEERDKLSSDLAETKHQLALQTSLLEAEQGKNNDSLLKIEFHRQEKADDLKKIEDLTIEVSNLRSQQAAHPTVALLRGDPSPTDSQYPFNFFGFRPARLDFGGKQGSRFEPS
jgi:hypothetical protein